MTASSSRSSAFRLLTALLFVAAATAARAGERVVSKDFAAEPGASLKIDTYRGSIEVRESEDDRIHVEIHEDPGTDDPAEMDRILGRLQVRTEQQGPSVSLTVRNGAETRVRFVWEEGQKIALSFAVRVPQRCNLDLATNDGGIAVDPVTVITGRMAARARMGTIFFRSVHGDISATLENGDLVVSRCTGAVSLKTLVGNIRVGTVRGTAVLDATNGDIEFQHALGEVKATSVAGNITVGFPGSPGSGSTIATDGGGITVRIDPAAHCSVDASSIWGRVHTALPFAVDSGGDGKRTMEGRLNGGGPRLVLHANGGQVRIDAPRI